MLREEFDDWAILFNPDTGRGFGLNPTGVYLWKLLDGGHTLDALVEEIRHGTEGVPEEARDHLVAFVDDLVAEGLAGFDSTLSGLPHNPDKAPLPPGEWSPGVLSVGNRFNYEPPKLVDLRGQSATGTCSCCSSGTNVGGDCNSNGACASTNCWPGTCASYKCLTVGNAASGRCCTGTSATGWANNCWAGNCPDAYGDPYDCASGGSLCQFGNGAIKCYTCGSGAQR
jgi:SynChlorMet cassette protein ScmD